MNRSVDLYEMPEFASFDIWKSPSHEESVYKNIPIEFLSSVRALIRKSLEDTGYMLIVRFQGPRTGRHNRHKMSTMKQDATHFMVYINLKPCHPNTLNW